MHVDVMDGHFVPNLTFGPKMVADLHKATRLPLDVHLMIERPDDWVDRYVDAGAAYVVVHVEAARDVSATLARDPRAAARRRASRSIPTRRSIAVLPYLDEVDLALVMSVNPGFGGQKFIESAIGKLQRLRKEIDARKLSVELEVDGGVKLDNVRRVDRGGRERRRRRVGGVRNRRRGRRSNPGDSRPRSVRRRTRSRPDLQETRAFHATSSHRSRKALYPMSSRPIRSA